MPQAPYTDDAHSVGRPDTVHFWGVEDRGTAAHQGCCVLFGYRVGNLEKVGLTPDGVGGKGTDVEVARAVEYMTLSGQNVSMPVKHYSQRPQLS